MTIGLELSPFLAYCVGQCKRPCGTMRKYRTNLRPRDTAWQQHFHHLCPTPEHEPQTCTMQIASHHTGSAPCVRDPPTLSPALLYYVCISISLWRVGRSTDEASSPPSTCEIAEIYARKRGRRGMDCSHNQTRPSRKKTVARRKKEKKKKWLTPTRGRREVRDGRSSVDRRERKEHRE